MPTGTYRDLEGNLVRVTRTDNGNYTLRYEDGRTVSIGDVR